jgi:hypothetical protein
MRVLFAAATLLAFSSTAGAHLGNENNTEIRVHADSMRLVLRTSIPFAWSLLGENAPAMADEAGQAAARPGLLAAAPALVTVTAAGKPMNPTQVDCVFEVPDDVAFIFHFKRPADWPVGVKMEFFDRLGSLETGTIAVFDYTASRFARDVEPFARKTLDRNHPLFSFTLVQPPVATAPVPPPPLRQPAAKRWIVAALFLAVSVAGIGWLAVRRLRGR